MAKRGEERKAREEAEARLVSTYIAQFYPEDYTMIRVRLGAIEPRLGQEELTAEELAMVGVFRRWADALVIRDRELILIEGAIRPSLGDISMLKGYKLLIPLTPELEKWATLPVRLQLVAAIEDPLVSILAQNEGIEFVRFTTPETDLYIASILPRFRRAPRTGGLIAE